MSPPLTFSGSRKRRLIHCQEKSQQYSSRKLAITSPSDKLGYYGIIALVRPISSSEHLHADG